MNISQLVYGFAGAGKTAYATSSFWDWEKREQIRNGRLLLIGREDNPALGIPEELIKRFPNPKLDSLDFMEEFIAYLKALYLNNQDPKKEHIDAVAIDSISELALVFEIAYGNAGDNSSKYRKWDELLKKFLTAVQLFDPIVLGAHCIATARVAERRKGTSDSKGATIGADPDYMEADLIPAMKGQFKLNLPHYFNIVSFMDTIAPKLQGTRRVEHRLHLEPGTDTLYKNQWEHLWTGPTVLSNKKFNDILKIIEDIHAN